MKAISSAEVFAASPIKIDRAKKHIKELEQIEVDYTASSSIQPISGFPSVPGQPSISQITLHIDNFSGELNAVLGDVIHNLRAALDLLASDLCRINNQSADSVYFPFCHKAEKLDEAIKNKNFHRAGPAAIRLLREWKPYPGGNTMLRAIHDLDIQDKHQMLIPTTVAISSQLFADAHGNFVLNEDHRPAGARLHFPSDSVLAGEAIIKTLHDLVDLTTRIVESFKALSAPAG